MLLVRPLVAVRMLCFVLDKEPCHSFEPSTNARIYEVRQTYSGLEQYRLKKQKLSYIPTDNFSLFLTINTIINQVNNEPKIRLEHNRILYCLSIYPMPHKMIWPLPCFQLYPESNINFHDKKVGDGKMECWLFQFILLIYFIQNRSCSFFFFF